MLILENNTTIKFEKTWKPVNKQLNKFADWILSYIPDPVIRTVNTQLNKFADWILSYIPEPVKRTVNERVEKLKS